MKTFYCAFEKGSQRRLAVDIGCGSGKITTMLGSFGFETVLGIDNSQYQLENAIQATRSNIESRISYCYGDGASVVSSDLIASNSCDMVTVGQALHWFPNIPHLCDHIDRILHPKRGCFCVMGYSSPYFKYYPKFDQLFKYFYYNTLKNGQCNRVQSVDNGYNNINFENLFANYKKRYDIKKYVCNETRVYMNEQQLFGYIESMSSYQKMIKSNFNMYETLIGGHDQCDVETLHQQMDELRYIFKQETMKRLENEMIINFDYFLYVIESV